MTAQEKIAIQQVNMKLDNHIRDFREYVDEDIKWKKQFGQVVIPLVQAEADKKLIHEWLKSKLYFVLKIGGFAAAIATVLYYLTAIWHPGGGSK